MTCPVCAAPSAWRERMMDPRQFLCNGCGNLYLLAQDFDLCIAWEATTKSRDAVRPIIEQMRGLERPPSGPSMVSVGFTRYRRTTVMQIPQDAVAAALKAGWFLMDDDPPPKAMDMSLLARLRTRIDNQGDC